MSDARESRREARARERVEREAERARDPDAYLAKVELQRLRDLLAEPLWTAAQAVHVFAGVHPGDAKWGVTTFLPGGRSAYPNDEVRENRIADSLDILCGLFDGEARSPADWMKRAAKFKIEGDGESVPWLSAALRDSECVARLPDEWRKRAQVIIEGKRRGQAGGRKKSEGDAKARAMRNVAEKNFPSFYESEVAHGGWTRWSAGKFGKRMAKEHGLSARHVATKAREWAHLRETQSDSVQLQTV
ncbi:MAG TPA: hypothetical protein VG841_02380 [Caulobacterales bacterium]|nr:hypothetical protein [Caulobacterales bacterium]